MAIDRCFFFRIYNSALFYVKAAPFKINVPQVQYSSNSHYEFITYILDHLDLNIPHIFWDF